MDASFCVVIWRKKIVPTWNYSQQGLLSVSQHVCLMVQLILVLFLFYFTWQEPCLLLEWWPLSPFPASRAHTAAAYVAPPTTYNMCEDYWRWHSKYKTPYDRWTQKTFFWYSSIVPLNTPYLSYLSELVGRLFCLFDTVVSTVVVCDHHLATVLLPVNNYTLQVNHLNSTLTYFVKDYSLVPVCFYDLYTLVCFLDRFNLLQNIKIIGR